MALQWLGMIERPKGSGASGLAASMALLQRASALDFQKEMSEKQFVLRQQKHDQDMAIGAQQLRRHQQVENEFEFSRELRRGMLADEARALKAGAGTEESKEGVNALLLQQAQAAAPGIAQRTKQKDELTQATYMANRNRLDADRVVIKTRASGEMATADEVYGRDMEAAENAKDEASKARLQDRAAEKWKGSFEEINARMSNEENALYYKDEQALTKDYNDTVLKLVVAAAESGASLKEVQGLGEAAIGNIPGRFRDQAALDKTMSLAPRMVNRAKRRPKNLLGEVQGWMLGLQVPATMTSGELIPGWSMKHHITAMDFLTAQAKGLSPERTMTAEGAVGPSERDIYIHEGLIGFQNAFKAANIAKEGGKAPPPPTSEDELGVLTSTQMRAFTEQKAIVGDVSELGVELETVARYLGPPPTGHGFEESSKARVRYAQEAKEWMAKNVTPLKREARKKFVSALPEKYREFGVIADLTSAITDPKELGPYVVPSDTVQNRTQVLWDFAQAYAALVENSDEEPMSRFIENFQDYFEKDKKFLGYLNIVFKEWQIEGENPLSPKNLRARIEGLTAKKKEKVVS